MTNEHLLNSKCLSMTRTTRVSGTGEELVVDFFHFLHNIQRFQKVSVRFENVLALHTDRLKKHRECERS